MALRGLRGVNQADRSTPSHLFTTVPDRALPQRPHCHPASAGPPHTVTLIHTCPGPSAAAAVALPPSLCGPVAMIRCFFDLSSAAWGQSQNRVRGDEVGS